MQWRDWTQNSIPVMNNWLSLGNWKAEWAQNLPRKILNGIFLASWKIGHSSSSLLHHFSWLLFLPLVINIFSFLLNLLGWHWLIKLYRFQVNSSITHHLYIVLCQVSFHHHLSPRTLFMVDSLRTWTMSLFFAYVNVQSEKNFFT